MARMQANPNQLTAPAWAGDFLNREHLVPGGARVDASQFAPDAAGRRFIPAGTAVGRTFAERDAGAGFGPATATDDEIYLTAFDVTDATLNADVELYRHGSIVKENFLPNFAGLDAGVIAKLRALYTTTKGVD
ncbi:MAG: hypothetical protein IRY83_13245 [Chloroflexi bacterium]|nr:hypothetical protein [Chloroflexota bacterium]